MKPIFDLKNYKDTSSVIYVMQCVTQDEAKKFTEFLHKNSRTWRSGKSYLEQDLFTEYGKDTCYFFNRGTYDSVCTIYTRNNTYFDGETVTILHFDDFQWSTEDTTELILTNKDDETFTDFMSPYLEVKNEI